MTFHLNGTEILYPDKRLSVDAIFKCNTQLYIRILHVSLTENQSIDPK